MNFRIETSEPGVWIVGKRAGDGPPLLLLHGNPLTHLSWARIMPRLAEHFTVVATDLRGYGDSSKPRGLPDSSNYTFRRMAQDQVDVMKELGFERFFVAGHDRGARTAFRMALDHPDRVLKAAFLDILPTHHVWNDTSRAWALNSYHWMFMAQPYPFPETLLRGNEAFYIRDKLMKQGLGKGGFTEEEILEYIRVCTPEQIHGVCSDYRAGATLDYEMDAADFEAGRRIACPVLVLWGEYSHTGKHYQPREAWPRYCSNIVRMQSLKCGHYPTEQAPGATYEELDNFFNS
jgi:haloacetate dehalogenase